MTMPRHPLVSLCVPSCNHAAYLPRLFDSLVANPYCEVELLMIDDGSRDGSDAVIRSYLSVLEARLHAVHYFARENRGLSRTLNELLQRCRGEYVKVIASDDYLHDESIAPFVDCLEHSGRDVVFGDLLVVDVQGAERYRRKGLLGLGVDYEIDDFCICDSLKESPTVGSAWLMRADAMRRVGGFDEQSRVEDWEFVNRLTVEGVTFAYVDKVAAYYRTFERKGPYFGSHLNWFMADLYILNKYREHCPASYRSALRNVLQARLAGSLREGLPDVAPLLRVALTHDPTALRVLFSTGTRRALVHAVARGVVRAVRRGDAGLG